MRIVRTLVRQGVFGDLACSRTELPDAAFEVCRKPDVACAISHQAMRAGVGRLQHLAGYRVQATQRIRFLSGVPERAIGGQRRIMGVGVGRGRIPLFDGDLCRRSVTAGFDSRACLAAKPATWRWWLNSAPKNTSRAKIAVTVRRLEKLGSCVHALFFEVMAEKADQPCSTFLLRQ